MHCYILEAVVVAVVVTVAAVIVAAVIVAAVIVAAAAAATVVVVVVVVVVVDLNLVLVAFFHAVNLVEFQGHYPLKIIVVGIFHLIHI